MEKEELEKTEGGGRRGGEDEEKMQEQEEGEEVEEEYQVKKEEEQNIMHWVVQKRSSIYTNLEYTGSVGCSPGIQEVVFTSANEPFSTVGEFQRQNAAFV